MDVKEQMVEIAKKYYIVSNRTHKMVTLPFIFLFKKEEVDFTTIYFSPRTHNLTNQEAQSVVEKIPYQVWLSVIKSFEKYTYKSKVTE